MLLATPHCRSSGSFLPSDPLRTWSQPPGGVAGRGGPVPAGKGRETTRRGSGRTDGEQLVRKRPNARRRAGARPGAEDIARRRPPLSRGIRAVRKFIGKPARTHLTASRMHEISHLRAHLGSSWLAVFGGQVCGPYPCFCWRGTNCSPTRRHPTPTTGHIFA